MGALSFEHWLLVIAIGAAVVAPSWFASKMKDVGKTVKSIKDVKDK